MATVPLTAALILAGLLYLRGWLRLRRPIPSWRAASFLTGLFFVWLAAASPLAMLDEELLTAHMVQHLLLMTVGPAFILLGFPATVLQIPERFRRMTPSPLFCWCVSAAVLVAWHLPAVFAVAFHSMPLHSAAHASFFIAGLLFWQPVIASRPGPYHAEWSVVLYLFMATLPCDVLSAFLAFCGRVVYPAYLNMPPHFGLSALEDQQCAGALMWTVVTIAYLIPAVLVTVALLSDGEPRAEGIALGPH
jgi:cytochrome c oxidase assembly factor CtaG